MWEERTGVGVLSRAGLLLIVLGLFVSLSGCVVSTQVGERSHVNAGHPEEIAFHFDTGFNKGVLFLRSGVLVLIAAWLVVKRTGGSMVVPAILAVLLVAAAIWLGGSGLRTVNGYRVDVTPEGLHWEVPGETTIDAAWIEIEGIEVEGEARNVSLGSDAPGSVEWAPQWEDLLIYLDDGRVLGADLRPLSVEQRGTFWRAIKRKAELTEASPASGTTRR